jgi:hypothetical protein
VELPNIVEGGGNGDAEAEEEDICAGVHQRPQRVEIILNTMCPHVQIIRERNLPSKINSTKKREKKIQQKVEKEFC